LGILGGKNEWEKGYDQAVYDIRSNLRDILKRAEALPIAAPPPTGTLEPLRESIKLAMEHIKGQRNISALEVLEAALAATPPASPPTIQEMSGSVDYGGRVTFDKENL